MTIIQVLKSVNTRKFKARIGIRPVSWERLLPEFLPEARIPPIIHQTYPRLTLPEGLQRNVEELIAANPRWKHRLYDDQAIEDFISAHYPAEVLQSYLRIKPDYGAARADLFRYLAIYRLGGVYLDIKSRFTRPIDDVLRGDEQYVISRWRNRQGGQHQGFGLHPDLAQVAGGEIQQWHVIAAPGHPFLRAVIIRVLSNIDRYRPWWNGVGRIGVFRLTGPIAYTLAIEPLLKLHPCVIVPNEGALALEYSITGDYVHGDAFKRHYSLNDTSILELATGPRWLGAVYTRMKRLKARFSSPLRDPW